MPCCNLSALAGYATTSCGTNIWTQKSSSSNPIGGVDQRSGGAPEQTGNIWIIWNNGSNPTVICAYLTVDSAVGDEMFFAVPKFTISIASGLVGSASANLIPTLTRHHPASGRVQRPEQSALQWRRH